MDIYDNVCPMDYRYGPREPEYRKKILKYLSGRARIQYQLKVQAALVRFMAKKGLCPEKCSREIEKAFLGLEPADVYREEQRIHHDVKAAVNLAMADVGLGCKRYVNMIATSFDIINTAEVLRYSEFARDVLIPDLLEFEKTLIRIARKEKNTPQMGRTHGRHIAPTTFGFTLSEYVSRIGNCTMMIMSAANDLRGKLSGALGDYKQLSMFIENPEEFEREFLGTIGLKPATHSTQITEPEYVLNLMHSVMACYGVLANLADDMRKLSQSEIDEINENIAAEQVAGTSIPHKRNPVRFENIKSLWKAFMPRMMTLYMDQISEQQRDLTNSASSRFTAEALTAFICSLNRMNRCMGAMVINRDKMKRNMKMSQDLMLTQPLFVLLNAANHPNPDEYVKRMLKNARRQGKSLRELVFGDREFEQYSAKLTERQRRMLDNSRLIGIPAKKTESVCSYWEQVLHLD